ncbi:hypothetical protein [Prevotella pallens]|uniref:hypothetical protein n=1 Tax=Prevotella pallens TaxID=60133 RepID=UPI0024935B61|nr:hypothetical protein [Prevotella pallens]
MIVHKQLQRTFRRRRGPIHRARPHELYKCNHASQWVHVGKRWCAWTIHSVCSMICGHDESAPYTGCTWVKRLVYVGKYYVYEDTHWVYVTIAAYIP